jgi:hypothetical protein
MTQFVPYEEFARQVRLSQGGFLGAVIRKAPGRPPGPLTEHEIEALYDAYLDEAGIPPASAEQGYGIWQMRL